MRHLSLAALLAAAATPLAAQQQSQVPVTKEQQHPASHDAAPQGQQPPAARPAANAPMAGITAPGWTARFDRPAGRPDQVSVVPMAGGLHVTTGPSAIYYDASRTATGAYAARATFTQTKASTHPEAYGLFVGGTDLAGPGQRYLYFVVRQDGKYTIKHRAGAEVHTLVDWTAHEAVKAIGAGAPSATNALEVRATDTTVRFHVNGAEVASLDRAKAMDVDGVVGLRVNHNLDVHVDGFAVTK